MRHLSLAALVLLPVLVLAQFDHPVSIAVNNLASSGITTTEAHSLTNTLRAELGKTGKYSVMERSQMEEVLKEQGFQQSGACDEATCAIEMGKLLAVNYMVLGSIGKVGKTYTLNIRLVDVSTGKIQKDVSQNYKGPTDGLLTRVVPIAAQELAGTYQKKSRAPFFIAAGAGVAAAIAVPLAILATRDNEPGPQPEGNLTVQW